MPFADKVVYYVVATRCEIDINGFSSIYEQGLNSHELALLVDGLNKLDEMDLARQFASGLQLLQSEGFYTHMNWDQVPAAVKVEIGVIGERVGDRLWSLDEKLASLLNGKTD